MTGEKQSAAMWDLPLRISHWLIVGLVGFSWWTAENDRMDWHSWSGYGLLTVLLFRLYWGFVGSTTARFSHFLRGPRAVWRYTRELLSREGKPWLGHNPLGGWSTLILLALLAAQVGLGLFAEDVDGLASGPLAFNVSYDTGRWAAETHEDLFDVLLIFMGLHIAAILFYLIYKRMNLIRPMISGHTKAQHEEVVYAAPLWRAIPGLVAAVLIVWWIVS